MGCCCSSEESADTAIEEVELETRNVANMPKIGLHSKHMKIARIDHGLFKIKGKGVALSSCMLEADIAYWEVVIPSSSSRTSGKENVMVGVSRFMKNQKGTPILDTPVDFTAVNECGDNNVSVKALPTQQVPFWGMPVSIHNHEKDTVVGVHFDQTDLPMLSFTVNDELQFSKSINRIKPSQNLYVSVSIPDGCENECIVIFDDAHFKGKPSANKFGPLICSSSLI